MCDENINLRAHRSNEDCFKLLLFVLSAKENSLSKFPPVAQNLSNTLIVMGK